MLSPSASRSRFVYISVYNQLLFESAKTFLLHLIVKWVGHDARALCRYVLRLKRRERTVVARRLTSTLLVVVFYCDVVARTEGWQGRRRLRLRRLFERRERSAWKAWQAGSTWTTRNARIAGNCRRNRTSWISSQSVDLSLQCRWCRCNIWLNQIHRFKNILK